MTNQEQMNRLMVNVDVCICVEFSGKKYLHWPFKDGCLFGCILCLRTFTGQAVGGDAWQSLSADVAEGRPGVRAGVPVVHPGEMLHVELAGLEGEYGRRQTETIQTPC